MTTPIDHTAALLRLERKPEPIVGTRGSHDLVRQLGEGGMAETFLAERHGLPGTAPFRYCIKRMKHKVKPAQFLQEVYLHLHLVHGLIVRAYEADYDAASQTCFLVMEFVDGVDLNQLLMHYENASKRVPLFLALHIAAEIAEALDFAHNFAIDGKPQNLIHQDVTPSNILLGKDGFLKLIDFGISAFSNRTKSTTTGHVRGKEEYIAPEQYDDKLAPDRRSDLFSLGVILYELISGGIRPFDRNTTIATLRAVLEGDFTPLQTYAPDVPASLIELVHQLLQPDREKRPDNARVVYDRLNAIKIALADPRQLAARGEVARSVTECQESKLRGSPAGQRGVLELMEGAQRAEEALARIRSVRAPPLLEARAPEPITDDLLVPAPDESAERGTHPEPLTAIGAQQTGSRRHIRSVRYGVASFATLIAAGLVATALHFAYAPTGSPEPAAILPAKQDDLKTPRALPRAAPEALPPTNLAGLPDDAVPADRNPTAMASVEPTTPKPSQSAARRVVQKPRMGQLLVAIQMHGFVKIDGHDEGAAPVRKTLSPGRHVVEVSEDAAGKVHHEKRETEVRSGKLTQVAFQLQPNPFQRSVASPVINSSVE